MNKLGNNEETQLGGVTIIYIAAIFSKTYVSSIVKILKVMIKFLWDY